MAFRDEWARDVDAAMKDASAVFNVSVELAKQSWQFGSPMTGSPGVIVDLGNLQRSIMREDVSPTEAIVSTNVVYAQSIEDGVSALGTPLTQRSTQGGFHALALTVSSFDRIVDAAVGSRRDTP